MIKLSHLSNDAKNNMISFGDMTNIPSFFKIICIMKYLYKNPNVCYQILKSSPQDFPILKSLCNLFSVQMYDNPFKPDIPVDEEFFIILTLRLKDELFNYISVDKCESILKPKDIAWNLLDILTNRSEIKTFFVNSLQNFIQQLDYNHEIKDITFDFDELINKLQSKKYKSKINDEDAFSNIDLRSTIGNDLRQPLDRAFKRNLNSFWFGKKNNNGLHKSIMVAKPKLEEQLKQTIILDNNQKIEKNAIKYMVPLKKQQIIDKIEETNDESTKDYLSKQLGILGNDSERFNIDNLLDKIFQIKKAKPENFVGEYSQNLQKIFIILDEFLGVIYQILRFVPASIKYVLTIISQILKKKYNITQPFEITGILMRFYFFKIIEPFINHLDYNGLTTIVANSTLNILKILTKIITKFFSGEMFSSKEDEIMYLPFNHYFIENISKYSNIFNEVINEKLPDYVNSIIVNDDITNENLQYDFFKEHPNILINKSIIYFNLQQFVQVYQILNDNRNLIDKKKNKTVVCALDGIDISTIKEESQVNKNFLSINVNDDYLNLNYPVFKLLASAKVQYSSIIEEYFLTKVTRNTNVINVMSYLKHILLECLPRDIPKGKFFSFDIQNMDDFIIALNALKEINYDQILSKGDVLVFLDLFIKNIKEIDNTYKNNDYKMFFNEYTNDINELIGIFDYDIILNLKFINDKLKHLIEKNNCFEEIMEQINSNNVIINFINKENILVRLSLSVKKKKDEVKLKIKGIKELQEDKDQKKHLGKELKFKRYCSNISTFIQKFRELYKLRTEQISTKNILLVLSNYLNQCIYPRINNDSMKEVLRDYIINKLYPILFPSIPDEIDLNLITYLENDESKIQKMNEMKMNFEDLFEKSKGLFIHLNNIRNPNEKFVFLQKIINIQKYITTKLFKISKDDELIVLEYLIMNAKPQMLNSHIQFVKMYKDFIDATQNEIDKILADYEGIINLTKL